MVSDMVVHLYFGGHEVLQLSMLVSVLFIFGAVPNTELFTPSSARLMPVLVACQTPNCHV
jgi:hypothetical protein